MLISPVVWAMGLFILLLSAAQSISSVVASSTITSVPSDEPIPGDYSGPYRPQVHFSPPQGFMNDPNGAFKDVEGVYHLYYQLNPTDLVVLVDLLQAIQCLEGVTQDAIVGNQHWGHATSRDLYHWENQPIALYPDREGEGVFTGSCVIDSNNTSGFFPNQTNGVVAVYTYNSPTEQVQDIAFSRDNGYTFTKYEANPVLSINSSQFRDPYVSWHALTNKWVMVIAYAQEFAVGFYNSPNLKDWAHVSNFSHKGLLGLQYECPNLVQLPTLKNASAEDPLDPSNFADADSWILFLSINPGAPLGGSVSQYFPGTFNGTHFSPYDDAARLTDFAKDAYAGQFFHNVDPASPQISIIWASNWQYTNVLPTAEEGFRSTMTLPRLSVIANTTRNDYALISTPYHLDQLYSTDSPIASSVNLADNPIRVNFADKVSSRAISFIAKVTGLGSPTGTVNFTVLSTTTNETLRGGLFLAPDSAFWLDRGNTDGFDNEFFTDKFSVTHVIDSDTGSFYYQVVLDRSLIEVFLDGGVKSGTSVFFTEGELDVLSVTAGGLSEGSTASAEVWGLESTWPANKTHSGGDYTSSTQTVGRGWKGATST